MDAENDENLINPFNLIESEDNGGGRIEATFGEVPSSVESK